MKYSRDLILTVKEMFVERNWQLIDIAHRCGIDIDDVRAIVDIIVNIAN